MKLKIIKAIKDSVAHWERMRAWMWKQEKKKVFDTSTMKIKSGESVNAEDCALCVLFKSQCSECVLAIKYGLCSYDDVSNAYTSVEKSKTYGEAAKNSTKMIRQLKSLLKEGK